jgi:glucosyl-dolichyl phosphate glucuronosyltransferase
MISIVVCTYNRAKSLRLTLESLFKLDIPHHRCVELLLVDNNSTDATRELVHAMQESSPFQLRYLFEPEKGLSFARNRGVREAKGEILAFTDDDVLVERNWLRAVEECFSNRETACAGGRIHPLWEVERPNWLTQELYNYLALLDLGDEARDLSEPLVYGANFVVRASMFTKYGLFETSIGRSGEKLYGGEESEFIERLLAGGERVCYLPDLVVHHYIPARRMRKSYFRKWIMDNAELNARQIGVYHHRNIAGIPLYAIRHFLLAMSRYLISLVLLKPVFCHELAVIRFSVFMAARLKLGRLRPS